jgi:hypothetical protein
MRLLNLALATLLGLSMVLALAQAPNLLEAESSYAHASPAPTCPLPCRVVRLADMPVGAAAARMVR